MASLVLTGALELQRMTADLLSEGKLGQKIFRKGLRAGAKVVANRVKATYPQKTGAAATSAKVKALKRQKGRIGVRVSVYAENQKDHFPYPMALEGGAKVQPRGVRVRKAVKLVTVGGRRKRVTDEAGSHAYHALTWRVEPGHYVQKAFDASAGQASQTILDTCVAEMEKASVK